MVAEALGVGPALEGLLEVPGARVINFEPSVTLALDEACRLQCRLSVETRTNAYQVRTGEFPEDQISVYFTVRQYWGTGPEQTFLESFRRQREIGEEIVEKLIIPRIVRPLAQAIARARAAVECGFACIDRSCTHLSSGPERWPWSD